MELIHRFCSHDQQVVFIPLFYTTSCLNDSWPRSWRETVKLYFEILESQYLTQIISLDIQFVTYSEWPLIVPAPYRSSSLLFHLTLIFPTFCENFERCRRTIRGYPTVLSYWARSFLLCEGTIILGACVLSQGPWKVLPKWPLYTSRLLNLILNIEYGNQSTKFNFIFHTKRHDFGHGYPDIFSFLYILSIYSSFFIYFMTFSFRFILMLIWWLKSQSSQCSIAINIC